MKLLIIGVQYSIAVLVADDHEEEAQQVADAAIQAGELKPLDRFIITAKAPAAVPKDWLTQAPYVGASVTDEAFAAITQDGEDVASILKRL